jgi:hypothetical protein
MLKLKTKLRALRDSAGFYFAAAYILIVIIVFVFTASTTTLWKAGYDWIPFILLTMPWCRFGAWFVLPGVIMNASLTYLMGTLVQALWNRIAPR